ncbi:MAG: chromate transporter [Victivallaceae bacterium]|nr:chromate transporter [Victivallaceae bacterium]
MTNRKNCCEDMPTNRRRLWLLFFIFARIAAFVVGGGYVILPMVEQELVTRRKWLKPQEFVDMTAVVQTIPGIIAGNAAIYLGYRIAGVRGAFFSLLGVATPSVIVITLIAMFFSMMPAEVVEASWVQGAFTGVKAAVCGMVLATALRMGRKVFTGWFEAVVGTVGFVLVVFFAVGPGMVMVGAGLLGILYCALRIRFVRGGMEADK